MEFMQIVSIFEDSWLKLSPMVESMAIVDENVGKISKMILFENCEYEFILTEYGLNRAVEEIRKFNEFAYDSEFESRCRFFTNFLCGAR